MSDMEWQLWIKLRMVRNHINLLISPDIANNQLGTCTARKSTGDHAQCGKAHDRHMSHAMHCKILGHGQHSEGVNTLMAAIQQIGGAVSRQASIPDSQPEDAQRGNRRGDLSVIHFDAIEGIRTNIIDFTTCSHQRKTWVNSGTYSQMVRVLDSAETAKNIKYRQYCENARMSFTPFAMSKIGTFGKAAKKFIKDLATSLMVEKFLDYSYAHRRLMAFIQVRVMRKICSDLLQAIDGIHRDHRARLRAA